MTSITQPLEFRKLIRAQPQPGFDFVPFLDALLIGVFIALNASAFIISPGADIRLPESSALLASRSDPIAVLTVDRNELFFFEGDKLSIRTLKSRLAAYVDARLQSDPEHPPTLLLKADESLSAGNLFNLMDLAREVGFARVHLAAEVQSADTVFPETP